MVDATLTVNARGQVTAIQRWDQAGDKTASAIATAVEAEEHAQPAI